jgi:hypothetical protein
MTEIEVGYFPMRAAAPGGPVLPLFHLPGAGSCAPRESVLTDTFRGYQSTSGYVTLGDPLADVIAFSGFPERIEITVLTFPAMVQLTDEQGRERPEIRIEANGSYDSQLRARKVRARNATAGSNATIQVIGKWAAPGGAGDAV